MNARVRVLREPARWTDRARAYKVVIDGATVGSLRHGQEDVFEVAPGAHSVRLRLDWAGSESMTVDLAPGEEARLQCGSRGGKAALYSVRAWNRYIKVERLD